MTGWIIAGCVAVVLVIVASVEVSTRWSRQEEKEDRRRLRPCPRCRKPPHLGYCCGEYFISGDDPNCPYCGTAFSEMHSSIDMEINAWNRRARKDLCPKCGGMLCRDESIVMTMNPALYRYECQKCGNWEYRIK